MPSTYVYANRRFVDHFSVVNPDTESLVGGLDSTDFTIHLWDPAGSDRTDLVDISEKFANSGYYSVGFTPDTTGDWALSIEHATYFPYGQSASYTAVGDSFFLGIDLDLEGSFEELLVFLLALQ